jgi:hypothetical protein
MVNMILFQTHNELTKQLVLELLWWVMKTMEKEVRREHAAMEPRHLGVRAGIDKIICAYS